MKIANRTIIHAMVCIALAAASMIAAAQRAYPAAPVRVLVPFVAGGPVDILIRAVGQPLAAQLGQPLVVDNKPGAAGNLAAAEAARAEPDGLTLFASTDSVFTINPSLYPKTGFAVKDLVPVSNLATSGLMLVVNPGMKVNTFAQLVARGKEAPLNYSSAGNGSPAHLATTLLTQATGMKGVHVPYKGSAPAVLAVISGEVNIGILPVPAVLQHVQSGKLIALAVTSAKRSPLAPQVPTLAELGMGAAAVEVTFSLYAPAKTPPAILQRLEKEIAIALRDPEVTDRLKAMDLVPDATPGAEVAKMIDRESRRWGALIKSTGMTID